MALFVSSINYMKKEPNLQDDGCHQQSALGHTPNIEWNYRDKESQY